MFITEISQVFGNYNLSVIQKILFLIFTAENLKD